MKRTLPFLIYLLVLALPLQSQDIHFSHFFAAPLNLNPALTGYFEGDYRIGGNVKNQWESISIPYRTFSVYGDYKIIKNINSLLSTGLVFINDASGTGDLNVRKITGSVAYQISFNFPVSVSAGIGIGYVNKNIDFNNFYFDEQWTSSGFNENIPSTELSGIQDLDYIDIHTGLLIDYTFLNDYTIFAGFNLSHAFTPEESFYGSDNQIGKRPVLHGGGKFQINEDMVVEPAFIYMKQKRAHELIAGANAGINLRTVVPTIIWGGLYVRTSGDAIPAVGIEYNSIKALISYDINFSTLKPASRLRGGLEFSLQYIGSIKRIPAMIIVPCIRY